MRRQAWGWRSVRANGGRWGRPLQLAVFWTFVGAPVWGHVVVYVSPAAAPGGDGASWATAFQDLQPALEAAAPIAGGGERVQIWLAAGSYVPSVRTDPEAPGSVTFRLLKRVEIYGGFAGEETELAQRDHRLNPTVLSGEEVAWHVVTASGTDETAVIDGVTIRDGVAGFGKKLKSDRGAGMLIIGGSPTVSRCEFRNNRVVLLDANGGGVLNRNGSPTFTECAFIDNHAEAGDGGAFASYGGEPRLVNCTFAANSAGFAGGAMAGVGIRAIGCTFQDNTAKGGGAVYGAGDFTGCTFERNVGGTSGGAVLGLADSAFTACRFVGNFGGFDGGAVAGGMSSVFTNSFFFGNSTTGLGAAVSGGGMFANCVFNSNFGGVAVFVSGSAPKISSCTFFNNEGGGASYGGPGMVSVNNSIFWRNSVNGVTDERAQFSVNVGVAFVNHSFIHGLTGSLGGSGNLGGPSSPNPILMDADGPDDTPGTPDDDLRLAAGSPCIDSGNNLALPADTYDLDGDGITDEPHPLDAALAPRRVDDPLTPDSGVGESPITDMGAYEYQPPIVCPADWNSDGVVESADVLDFLTDFYQADADYNDDGVTNSQDFFDFLVAFYVPCL